MAYFPPLSVNGEELYFLHLEPLRLTIESAKVGRNLSVHVTFSNHCFSRGLVPGEDTQGLPVLDTDTTRPRVFCQERYDLSHRLPEILKGFEDPRLKVRQTSAERNWVYFVAIDTPDQGIYYIFFEIKKASKAQNQDLNLIIESAYTRKTPPQLRREKMKFSMMCSKVYRNERVMTRR